MFLQKRTSVLKMFHCLQTFDSKNIQQERSCCDTSATFISFQKTKITQPCMMCRTTRLVAEMVDNKNSDDSVSLFCSSSCVMAFMVQTVSASGTNGRFSLMMINNDLRSWSCFSNQSCFFFTGARLNCDNCEKNTVPSYHLAMSDTTIRNFCTLPCVMAFQVMLCSL